MNAATATLPTEVNASVEKWLGSNGTTLYFWEQSGTYFVVTKYLDRLCFLRLFLMGNEYVLSQDHECEA